MTPSRSLLGASCFALVLTLTAAVTFEPRLGPIPVCSCWVASNTFPPPGDPPSACLGTLSEAVTCSYNGILDRCITTGTCSWVPVTGPNCLNAAPNNDVAIVDFETKGVNTGTNNNRLFNSGATQTMTAGNNLAGNPINFPGPYLCNNGNYTVSVSVTVQNQGVLNPTTCTCGQGNTLSATKTFDCVR